MNKLFNFAQAKGKWHKFPSFNLKGGAKLYKNFAQKLLAVSLCMAVVLLGTPVTTYIAEAADPTVVASGVMIANLKYTLYSDGTATLTGYDEQNLPTEIDVSTVTYNGLVYSVTAVASWALARAGVSTLRSVSLPLVSEVGTAAFFGGLGLCSYDHALVSVDLPSAVRIGDSAFAGANQLTSFYAPSLVTVGESAFAGCSSLPSVALPSCASVGESAFADCLSLATVDLPALSSVGYMAFASCTSLLDVSLPSATFIDECAFVGCTSLRYVSLPLAASLGDLGTHQSYKGDGVFSGCTSLVSVSAPSATVLGNEAFFGCESLESLVLPAVRDVGRYAFWDCSSLSALSLPSLVSLGEFAFLDCASLSSLALPVSVSSVSADAFAGVIATPENGLQESIDPPALTTLFYKQGLNLTAAGVPATANQLAYTVDETQDAPGKTKVTLVSSTNTAPTTVACDAMGTDYVITGIAPALASKLTLTHDMVGQSCTSAAACSFCGAAGPTALGHAWDARGICLVCGALDPTAATPADFLHDTVLVDGKPQRLRVYDPNGVLPADTTFTAEYVDGTHGDHNFFITHTDPTSDVELRHYYNLTLTSGSQTLSQLDGPIELWFEAIDGIDAPDAFISRVTEGADAKLAPEVVVDADGVTWIKVLTDHFSPYALTDLLSAEEKAVLGNVKTGDLPTQITVAGLGMTLVLALGIMLRLITNRKKI